MDEGGTEGERLGRWIREAAVLAVDFCRVTPAAGRVLVASVVVEAACVFGVLLMIAEVAIHLSTVPSMAFSASLSAALFLCCRRRHHQNATIITPIITNIGTATATTNPLSDSSFLSPSCTTSSATGVGERA